LPLVWQFVELLNSFFFSVRYRRGLSSINDVLILYQDDYSVRLAELGDVDRLVTFFNDQPDEAFKFFNPHPFDAKTIARLIKNKAYLLFVVLKEEQIVGYFFLRCFFVGKAFLGKMVDANAQGKGIGTQMCLCAMDVAQTLGIRMFETISKENIASLRSTEKVLDVRIVEEMENNYLYIEDLRKKSD
jgi:L-amino acid N-acyltransferase YncA